MFTIASILLILISILLIAAVLLQPGKGDLSATFGGISGQFGSMFGMQRTMDALAKFTRYVAIVMLLLILVTNKFFVGTRAEEVRKPVTEGAKAPSGPVIPPSAMPNSK